MPSYLWNAAEDQGLERSDSFRDIQRRFHVMLDDVLNIMGGSNRVEVCGGCYQDVVAGREGYHNVREYYQDNRDGSIIQNDNDSRYKNETKAYDDVSYGKATYQYDTGNEYENVATVHGEQHRNKMTISREAKLGNTPEKSGIQNDAYSEEYDNDFRDIGDSFQDIETSRTRNGHYNNGFENSPVMQIQVASTSDC